MRRPLLLYPLLLLQLLLSASALFGSWSLLTDPIGLGVQLEWLRGSPFRQYTVPGLFLGFFQGVWPLITAIGLWWRPHWPWANALNLYPDRYWAWTYSLYTGLILIGWIAVQILWIPAFWLQPLLLAVGLLILMLTCWPSVMRYFETAARPTIQTAP